MANSKIKTNAMRILDKAKIVYNLYDYDSNGEAVDGVSVAHMIGKPEEQVFKTLVTQGASREFYVFVIPVAKELDLKAAARSVGEKSVEMIKVADINKITGYVRGGCSPVGMKKSYKTVIDAACENVDTIIVSAGKIGHQIEIKPKELVELVRAEIAPITH